MPIVGFKTIKGQKLLKNVGFIRLGYKFEFLTYGTFDTLKKSLYICITSFDSCH